MGGNRGKYGLTIDNPPNSEISDSGDTGLLLEIRFLEEGGRGICGSAVAIRAIFCMSYMDEYNTASHTRSIGLRYDLSVGKEGVWVVLAPSDPRLPSSAFY